MVSGVGLFPSTSMNPETVFGNWCSTCPTSLNCEEVVGKGTAVEAAVKHCSREERTMMIKHTLSTGRFALIAVGVTGAPLIAQAAGVDPPPAQVEEISDRSDKGS